MTKILMNDGYGAGKLIVREEFVNKAQLTLIELMYLSIGAEFDEKMLRNPDWRFAYEWTFEEKAVWAAQVYSLLKQNDALRRRLLRIPVTYQRELHAFIYSFGNKYGFRQSRELRHVDASRLIRYGNFVIDRERSKSNSVFGRIMNWFQRRST